MDANIHSHSGILRSGMQRLSLAASRSDSVAAPSVARRQPVVRPALANPRTGLPSHLGPTLERIDQLLDLSSNQSPFPLYLEELLALDGSIHDARGQDEVLVLLDSWALLEKRVGVEQRVGTAGALPSTPSAHREARASWSAKSPVVIIRSLTAPAISLSWPELPTVGDEDGWASTPRAARLVRSVRQSVASPRRLCAFDEAAEEYARAEQHERPFVSDPVQRVEQAKLGFLFDVELRALAKATAILLDALLASLLRNTERVIAMRQYWTYYSMRPVQYIFWRGPRAWLGVHPLRLDERYFCVAGEPSERIRVLSELISLMASHIGRVHASLATILRCDARAQLQAAVQAGAATLDGLLSTSMPLADGAVPSRAAADERSLSEVHL
ncbi:hypothetical protein T492DRAFT_832469 [Pavlovales sp. CCMP2436]|nr:hypothetical protein T492DRAFT_832469 [Pavlovales sp. CCMP2436]